MGLRLRSPVDPCRSDQEGLGQVGQPAVVAMNELTAEVRISSTLEAPGRFDPHVVDDPAEADRADHRSDDRPTDRIPRRPRWIGSRSRLPLKIRAIASSRDW